MPSRADLNTLIDFRYRQHIKARPRRTMAKAATETAPADPARTAVIKVPVGTQILDQDKQTLIADLTEVGQSRLARQAAATADFGNAHYKSVDQPGAAPRRSRLAG